ncbi:hypothetical protein BO86DRAFT_77532 [Aspergillus japonicus CBS 114.51]|uniref:Uncharacterized protein n=1 Tax=Aspergillus japonicus CBS 114.51 TaxID=1448312 RepID=A0A8T8XFN9_ASPJA|nr:hypothetical protein BO86DRAFT_77532 [Aspergillus japonicus CBS 114.51]RAH87086.1 hypothetical protein BO86DRAFT_77532 [Aspergillus japonicus CBS 114.51]
MSRSALSTNGLAKSLCKYAMRDARKEEEGNKRDEVYFELLKSISPNEMQSAGCSGLNQRSQPEGRKKGRKEGQDHEHVTQFICLRSIACLNKM